MRERTLLAARKHVERLTGPDRSVTKVEAGSLVDNARRRTGKLGPDDARQSRLT
ncbi:hypothetical protein [Actinacidiphila sp. bgisy160]|uniref:hypothetical protein n=1 Tax=Actinacidiphila sp. bgisy160 TaxID=3413796 RepID=UPI003D712617